MLRFGHLPFFFKAARILDHVSYCHMQSSIVLSTFGPSLSYTMSLKIIDPADPHLPLDMLTIILVVPCTHFGLLLWNQQKMKPLEAWTYLPWKKGSEKDGLLYGLLKTLWTFCLEVWNTRNSNSCHVLFLLTYLKIAMTAPKKHIPKRNTFSLKNHEISCATCLFQLRITRITAPPSAAQKTQAKTRIPLPTVPCNFWGSGGGSITRSRPCPYTCDDSV